MKDDREKLQLVDSIPRFGLPRGIVGIVRARFLISQTVTMQFGSRIVTVRKDQLGPVEKPKRKRQRLSDAELSRSPIEGDPKPKRQRKKAAA